MIQIRIILVFGIIFAYWNSNDLLKALLNGGLFYSNNVLFSSRPKRLQLEEIQFNSRLRCFPRD